MRHEIRNDRLHGRRKQRRHNPVERSDEQEERHVDGRCLGTPEQSKAKCAYRYCS